MRILYLCNEYPPHLHGGIGSFTRDIAEGMVNAGNDVTVWGLYSGIEQDVYEEINGVKVVRKKYSNTFSRLNFLKFIIDFNLAVRRYLNVSLNFDVIECQEWQGLLPFGLNHPNLVIRIHGAAIFFDHLLNRHSGRLVHWTEKRTLKKAKHLVAVSDYCGEKTLKIANLPMNYTVIFNAIKSNRIRKYSQNTFNRYQIVFANSLLPKKGVFELAEAFNTVARKFPQAELIFIGKTNYSIHGINVRELIAEKVEPQFRYRLKVLGWLDSADDVYKWLSQAHVCVYPSHMEGFGIAPVEAMVLGKPTIFMKDGPGPEVIEDGVSGLLVDTKNAGAIAESISTVFEDSQLSKRLGEEAFRRSLKLFDLEEVFVPKNIIFYKSIMDL